MMTLPIIMEATVSALAVGKTVILNDESRLRNPFKNGMLLDEIRILSSKDAILSPVELSLRYRGHDLMKDLLDVRFLGPRQDAIGHNTSEGANQYRCWRLPKPLWVESGDLVIPSVRNVASTGSTAVNVSIVYLGRQIPLNEAPPKEVIIPWVTRWKPDIPPYATWAAPPNQPAWDAESLDTDLCNPFPTPLYVQKVMGAYFYNAGWSTWSTGVYTGYGDGFEGTACEEMLQVTIIDSQGNMVVRDPTLFSHLFPQKGPGGWLVKTILPPGASWRVRLHSEPSGTINAALPQIAMFGYRTVKI